MDEAKLEQFMGGMVGNMTGAMLCFGVWLGDEVGFYAAMNGAGPLTADAVAERAGTNARLTREWLDGQAAGGLLEHDAAAGTYTLSEEAVAVLADENSPVFLARALCLLGSLFNDIDKIAGAFKGDGKLSWGDHHPHLFRGTEWFFRTGYRAMLTTEWIPALDGVVEKLEAGAAVADVGCGHGASVVVLAEAYPNSRISGFDFHEPSIATAGKRAAEAGIADRVLLQTASATEYPGTYDLICFFDCLHDMGDPVGIARYAREHLNPGGSLLMVEPFALDGRENLTANPMAALFYGASSAICTPNSLSQDVGLGLGAQAGPARLTDVLSRAGFGDVQVVASSPVNLIFQARV
ncbi:MAG: class I SAM-dependent methyltransferase [Sporichthyaceae bacterium]